jgi:hypothetical protein
MNLGEPVNFNFLIDHVMTEDISIQGTSYLFLTLILITTSLGLIISIFLTKLDRQDWKLILEDKHL